MKNKTTLYEYKNFFGTIEYSIEDGVYFGKIININDLVNYEADGLDELYGEFVKAVDDYVEHRRFTEEVNND